ncbi:MAG TPA: hypothetical protein VGQ10_16580 [Vicinamibacterales bacterium]|nr:hypothetical protein [Vicinamibacterales bacterium]
MNDVWLGIIAMAVAVMAGIQIGAVVVALRVAKRMDHLASQFEQDIKPVMANITRMTAEAARAASLAATQIESADRVLGDFAQRVEQTLSAVQSRVFGPAREGAALLAGIRAALAAFRDLRESGRRRGSVVEDEDALFIG